jgi:hypothetical protein
VLFYLCASVSIRGQHFGSNARWDYISVKYDHVSAVVLVGPFSETGECRREYMVKQVRTLSWTPQGGRETLVNPRRRQGIVTEGRMPAHIFHTANAGGSTWQTGGPTPVLCVERRRDELSPNFVAGNAVMQGRMPAGTTFSHVPVSAEVFVGPAALWRKCKGFVKAAQTAFQSSFQYDNLSVREEILSARGGNDVWNYKKRINGLDEHDSRRQ